MIKRKNIQPSAFWTNLADRLRFSRSFSFYTAVDAQQAMKTLRKYQSRPRQIRRYTLETDSQPEITEFRLMVFLRSDQFLEAWAVGQIQPVENMERVYIQGKVYPNLRPVMVAISGMILSVGFLLIGFMLWRAGGDTMENYVVFFYAFLLVFASSAIACYEVLDRRNRLLDEIGRQFPE